MKLALPYLRTTTSTTPAAHWHTLTLAPRAAPQAIRLGTGSHLLQSGQGRVWLTREGDISDYFVAPGTPLLLQGPARLHVSAEGASPAALRWQ